MKHPATVLAWAFAATFFGAALLGFVPNPIFGKNALLLSNTAHDLVHLTTAIAFVSVALLGENISIRFMQAFGIVYMLTAEIGFVTLGAESEGYLLKVVRINQLDNLLHLGLGASIAAAGWLCRVRQHRQMIATHP